MYLSLNALSFKILKTRSFCIQTYKILHFIKKLRNKVLKPNTSKYYGNKLCFRIFSNQKKPITILQALQTPFFSIPSFTAQFLSKQMLRSFFFLFLACLSYNPFFPSFVTSDYEVFPFLREDHFYNVSKFFQAFNGAVTFSISSCYSYVSFYVTCDHFSDAVSMICIANL